MAASIVASIASGGAVGFSLGLLGGGGSILAVPLLLYVVGVSNAHVAIGTSALAVSVSALANFAGHARAGNVWWRCAIVFAAVGTLGALVASSVAKAVDGESLLFLFGLVMVGVGLAMLRPKIGIGGEPRPVDARMCWITAAVALATGALSGFFGIGGGFLIVPGLIAATGMPMINAIGSSLLAISAFGLATALNYSASGLVDWAVALQFIGGGILGGAIGIAAAGRLSSRKGMLNRLFAVLVLCVAGYVLLKGTGGA
ncbi:sulfite exporter TauE/SafE family protein [Ensifer sp. MPMI2T]|nr:sulfite exporter TauE/SafE family protein [Ensifer sp. MPMI2T]